MATKNDLGGAIRRLRLAAQMTQTELADRLDTTQATVSRWERDAGDGTAPSLEECARIESALGLARGALLVAGGYVEVPTVEAALLADPALDASSLNVMLLSYRSVTGADLRKGRKGR